MKRNWKPKDPADVAAVREFDWTASLGEGETVTATTAVPEGAGAPVVTAQVAVDGVQQVKLSGGTVQAAPYTVLLTRTSSGGETISRRVRIKVRLR
jgi:hypothetical protein